MRGGMAHLPEAAPSRYDVAVQAHPGKYTVSEAAKPVAFRLPAQTFLTTRLHRQPNDT